MSDERIVELSDDQHARMWHDRRTIDAVGKILGTAILQAAEEAAYAEEKFWQVVHDLAGADEHSETVSIDWVKRTVKVKKKQTT